MAVVSYRLVLILMKITSSCEIVGAIAYVKKALHIAGFVCHVDQQ